MRKRTNPRKPQDKDSLDANEPRLTWTYLTIAAPWWPLGKVQLLRQPNNELARELIANELAWLLLILGWDLIVIM